MTELWLLHGVEYDVRCLVRPITHTAPGAWGADFVGFDLRIEQGGELMMSHLCKSQAEVDDRSAAIRADLEAQGWTPIA